MAQVDATHPAKLCTRHGCYTEDRLVTCSKCSGVIRRGEPRHSFIDFTEVNYIPTYHCACVPKDGMR